MLIVVKFLLNGSDLDIMSVPLKPSAIQTEPLVVLIRFLCCFPHCDEQIGRCIFAFRVCFGEVRDNSSQSPCIINKVIRSAVASD